MNNIGIVTITNGSNFGNRLQNYGLQKTLEKIGYNAETLVNKTFEEEFSKKDLLKIKIKSFIKYFVYPKKTLANKKRDLQFKKFNDEFIKFSKYEVFNDINKINSKINQEYKYFCCGSDQIWNPCFKINASANFLQFANSDKRVAYAPSMGVDEIPSNRIDEYKKYIEDIEKISIREKQGAEIIKKLTGRDVPVLIDPTMLLDNDEWAVLAKKPQKLKNEKYILNYFLGEMSLNRKKEIEKIAEKNNCKIINVLDFKDPYFSIGPSEFLYLEKNAFLICTDSFHSCVFAFLFNRPFIVFNREDKNVSMNSRIENLLLRFELRDRRFEGKITEKNLKHDYAKSYKILEQERENANKFLKSAVDSN